MRSTIPQSLKYRGVIQKTPLCNGYTISTAKGEDMPCCAFCFELRKAYYREEAFFITSEIAYEFVKDMKNITFTISLCGKIPTICFPALNIELSIGSYIKALKSFFIDRNNKLFLNRIVKESSIIIDNFGFPIVVPDEKRESFGNDDGVLIKREKVSNDDGKTFFEKEYIIFQNFEKAYKSGKWMYILNFYQTLLILNPKTYRLETKEEGGERWYAIYE